jgi:ketosteroid isomerase-like protein
MHTQHNRELARRYWESLGKRDWAAFAQTLAEDVLYEVPQTRERVCGREAHVDFNATFPGNWTIEVVRLVADETGACGQIVFRDKEHEQIGIAFLEMFDGKIQRIFDYWPEPYEPPLRMSKYVERY